MLHATKKFFWNCQLSTRTILPSRKNKGIYVQSGGFSQSLRRVETGKKADGTSAIQMVEKSFIPEGDLYRLIVRSHLPSAERFERWVFDEVLPTIRKHGFYFSDAALHRLHEKIDRLEDENYQLQQRVKGLGSGHGSFRLWDVAQQLRKNNIGDGNVHKTLQMMTEHGLLLKDMSVKKRSFYRPFLKDIRAGYFDHELTNNGQPVPVWQSQITVTAKGLDWIVRTFLSLRDRKWERERPMIRYSRVVQCRLADIPPEAGGRIMVADEYGKDIWIN